VKEKGRNLPSLEKEMDRMWEETISVFVQRGSKLKIWWAAGGD